MLNENDKLAKLIQRAKLIKDNLSANGYGYLQVKPIIVSSLTRTEVEADMDVAKKFKIAVICREDLDDLLKLVVIAPNAEKLFDDVDKYIPSNMEEDLFPNMN